MIKTSRLMTEVQPTALRRRFRTERALRALQLLRDHEERFAPLAFLQNYVLYHLGRILDPTLKEAVPDG